MEDNSSLVQEGSIVNPERENEVVSAVGEDEADMVDSERGMQVASNDEPTDENCPESAEVNQQEQSEIQLEQDDSQPVDSGSVSEESSKETPESSKAEEEVNAEVKTSHDDEPCSKELEVQDTVTEAGDSESTESPSATNTASREEDMFNKTYYVKWVNWKGVQTPIVTQNDNGPCPLLAIINILLLRRAIEFPSMQEMVTTSQLMEYLGDHVLKEIPENMAEGTRRNFEQNMQDALSILPKLRTGLDVNVKFTGVDEFEFTPECVIFDLLNIHLYHGWLVDPQNIEYNAAIGGLSYNQLVEKIVASKEENAENQLASEGLAADSFLRETANQLTCHGVCELNAKVQKDELCVFFRNNHFSTLYKHQNELFLLLTDQGFLTEDQIVWQTLSNVDGDGVFVNDAFKTLPMKDQPVSPPAVSSSGALSQQDQDYMLALSIQSEQQQQPQQQQQQPQQQQPQSHQETPAQPSQEEQDPPGYNPSHQELLDLQYAMQLQEEENQLRNQPHAAHQERRATRRQTPPPQQPRMDLPPNQNGPTGKGCVIL